VNVAPERMGLRPEAGSSGRKATGAVLWHAPEEGARGGTRGSPTPNQLLRIEEELGEAAAFPGWGAFPRVRS
jgi:hypothetical protein